MPLIQAHFIQQARAEIFHHHVRLADQDCDFLGETLLRQGRRSLKQLGEPMYLLESNPTVERIARLIYDYAVSERLPVVRVTVWETPTSFATYGPVTS